MKMTLRPRHNQSTLPFQTNARMHQVHRLRMMLLLQPHWMLLPLNRVLTHVSERSSRCFMKMKFATPIHLRPSSMISTHITSFYHPNSSMHSTSSNSTRCKPMLKTNNSHNCIRHLLPHRSHLHNSCLLIFVRFSHARHHGQVTTRIPLLAQPSTRRSLVPQRQWIASRHPHRRVRRQLMSLPHLHA